MEAILLSLVLIALFTVLLLAGARFHRGLISRHLEPLKELLKKPELREYLWGFALTGEYREKKAKIELRVGDGQRHVSYNLSTSLVSNTPFHLAVYRKGFICQMGKMLGLVRDVTVGDPEFEKEHMIRAKNEIPAREFLARASHREIFEKILRKSYRSVIIDEGAIKAGAKAFSRRDLKDALIRLL